MSIKRGFFFLCFVFYLILRIYQFWSNSHFFIKKYKIFQFFQFFQNLAESRAFFGCPQSNRHLTHFAYDFLIGNHIEIPESEPLHTILKDRVFNFSRNFPVFSIFFISLENFFKKLQKVCTQIFI